jgi:sugar phosphate isomerase/epimerase
LGVAYWNAPERDTFEPSEHSPKLFELLDLPAQLRSRGFDRLELCHFHLPSREKAILEQLKAALADSGVTLQTLLIDSGDISNPEHADRDRDWIASWVEAAHILGAEGTRVIAGKETYSPEALALSANNLSLLADRRVRIRIENWFDLLTTPTQVHELLDRLEGRVGLCVDLGNWGQPNKYEKLAAIAGRAETCHAKCDFLDPETIDTVDFEQSLNACRSAGYNGPYVIVYCGTGTSDWAAIEIQRDFLLKGSGRDSNVSP